MEAQKFLTHLPISRELSSTRMKMTGFLVAYAINSMLEPDGDFGGCCTINCGPCHALAWFRDEMPTYLDLLVHLAYPEKGPENYWSWQDQDGRINWPMLNDIWATHKGCSYSPEEGWRCHFEENADE